MGSSLRSRFFCAAYRPSRVAAAAEGTLHAGVGRPTQVDDVLAKEAHDYLLQPSIVKATFDYWCRQTHGAVAPLTIA
jgi:hypothetical protein